MGFWGDLKAGIQVDKQARAVTKIAVNLFEASTESARRDHGPLVLDLKGRHSRFRHMNFCLSTAFYFSAERMTQPDRVLEQCQTTLVDMALSYAGPDRLVEPASDRKDIDQESKHAMETFLNGWS